VGGASQSALRMCMANASKLKHAVYSKIGNAALKKIFSEKHKIRP
jgi:hypothetical protein